MEYCYIKGVDIEGEEFETYPFVVTINSNGINKANLFYDSKKQKSNVFNMIQSIIEDLKKCFVDVNLDAEGLIEGVHVEHDLAAFFDGIEWHDYLNNVIAKNLMKFLVNTGWELMDREGYWFKRIKG